VAEYAVRAIPGAEGAGLTLLEENQSDTIVSTADFVAQIDDIQYSLGQGPCLSAVAEPRIVLSGSLGGHRALAEVRITRSTPGRTERRIPSADN
jgi:hypothetical protein